MGAPLTLISAASSKRLAKTFSPKGTEPYPRISRINSFDFETEKTQDGLAERFALLKEKSGYGYALHKGQFKKQLQDESRKGQTDTHALTHSLILDIDGWPTELPAGVLTSTHVHVVADSIVKLLPPCFHTVSYIAHASASFGVKKGVASVHIEFILKEPVAPRALKGWIRQYNLECEAIADKLRLTNSKQAISWVLDPCVADNSRIIYLAPPEFYSVTDPFNNQCDERWVLVQKDEPAVDLYPELSGVSNEKVTALSHQKLKALRAAEGLPTRKQRTQKLKKGDLTINIVTDPMQMQIEVYRIEDEYAIFNINGGDSNAYWCYLTDPDIIYNFKGEQPFQFSKADPEGFEAFLSQYGDEITSKRPTEPFVFRDKATDTFYIGMYDAKRDRFDRSQIGRELDPIARGNIENSFADKGGVMPDVIPEYRLTFDPRSPIVVDKVGRTVNMFEMPEELGEPAELPDEVVNVGYDPKKAGENNIAAYLNAVCPNLHNLIWHIVGNDATCYEHFINWLAFCAQHRRVSATAWVMSGVPGTGKGMFFTQIIQTIWGTDLAALKELKNLEDDFNGGLDRLLMIAVDEVHFSDSRNPGAALDRVKHLIGTDVGTVRAMRTDQKQANYYFNFMLFSNHLDAVPIEPDDRRFNVCPPQMAKLAAVHPELTDLRHTEKVFPEERPLFASFLMHFDCDPIAARTCLNNAAKRNMQVHAMGSYERFFDAIKTGNLDYFVTHIIEATPDSSNYTEVTRIATARALVKQWVQDAAAGETSTIQTADLRVVYHGLYPQNSMSSNKFGSMLSKNGLLQQQFRLEGKRVRGFRVDFNLEEYDEADTKRILDQMTEQPAMH